MSYQFWPEISFYLNEIEQQKNQILDKTLTPEKMDEIRKKIAELLEQMKLDLEQRLDKIHTSLVIFAIVAFIDEEIQNLYFIDRTVSWSLLQKDFYGAYNAGELFYKSVDDILDDPKIPQIVFEIFYYILKKGFKGKYKDSKTQISKYLEMLSDKIPSKKAADDVIEEETASYDRKKDKVNRGLLYTLSFCALMVTYIFLHYLTHLSS